MKDVVHRPKACVDPVMIRISDSKWVALYSILVTLLILSWAYAPA